MSIPDPEAPAEAPVRSRRIVLALRVGAAMVAAFSLLSLWWSERTRVRDDLQLSAEAAAEPGQTLALRAFYLADVEAPTGPSLRTLPVTVRLLDARAREVARTELRPAHGDASMEGRLRVPSAARGGYWLEARTDADPAPLLCRRDLLVSTQAPTLAAQPRTAPPLQQMALGALHPSSLANDLLLARVSGGACVPEEPCRLLVWMGTEPAELRVRHDASVSLEHITPAGEARGIVQVALRVHGPEASLTLEAYRGGKSLASRALRLPVALGEALLRLRRSVFRVGEAVPLEVVLPPGRQNGILDVFEATRWSATRGFTGPEADRLEIPPEWLHPGLVRVQAHVDRFAGEGAGARLFYVRQDGESEGHMLRAIGRALRAAGADVAPLDEGLRLQPAPHDAEAMAELLLAELETLRVPLPAAVSGRPEALRRLSRGQTALRYTVGGLLALSALAVSMSLMRRGLSAQREAEGILREAFQGDAEERNRKPRWGVYYIVFFVFAVGLAFLLAALLIVAKPLWF